MCMDRVGWRVGGRISLSGEARRGEWTAAAQRSTNPIRSREGWTTARPGDRHALWRQKQPRTHNENRLAREATSEGSETSAVGLVSFGQPRKRQRKHGRGILSSIATATCSAHPGQASTCIVRSWPELTFAAVRQTVIWVSPCPASEEGPPSRALR